MSIFECNSKREGKSCWSEGFQTEDKGFFLILPESKKQKHHWHNRNTSPLTAATGFCYKFHLVSSQCWLNLCHKISGCCHMVLLRENPAGVIQQELVFIWRITQQLQYPEIGLMWKKVNWRTKRRDFSGYVLLYEWSWRPRGCHVLAGAELCKARGRECKSREQPSWGGAVGRQLASSALPCAHRWGF